MLRWSFFCRSIIVRWMRAFVGWSSLVVVVVGRPSPVCVPWRRARTAAFLSRCPFDCRRLPCVVLFRRGSLRW
ncbi:hypothetical protein BC567DRAFT_218845 [Phyllosticta citribraziliensis]